MKFHKVKIQNFLGIGEAEIEFNYNGLVLINGENRDSPVSTSNGASKSTIPEAILWCLYGTTKRGLKGDDVINRTVGGDCVVQVWFDSYRVERHRASDCGNSLRVFDGDTEITKGTTQATQELVEQIVGRGRLAFEKLFHFGQGDTAPLASMTDANLKTIFEESFNLGFIKDCFVRIKDVERVQEGELMKIEIELSDIQRDIDATENYISSLEEFNKHFEAKKRSEIEQIEEEIKSYRVDLINLHADIDALYILGAPARSDLEIKRQRTAELIRMAKIHLKEMNDAMSRSNANYQVALRDAKSYRDNLLKMCEEKKAVQEKVGTPCPTCKKTIEKDDVGGVVKAFDEKIEGEVSKIDHYKNLMADADRQKEQQQSLLQKAEEALNKAMEEDAAQAIIWQKYLEYEAASLELAKKNEQIEYLKKKIESVKAEENPVTAKLQASAEEVKKKKKVKKEKEKDGQKQSQDLELIRTLAEIFGNAGLKSYIFDSITPRLNELINQYLHRLDNLSVEFTTQKQLKSGDLREKFDIIIQTENGSSSFDALSGGEKQRVSLAISLAMNKLMREIAGDPLNILFLDEVAEALDETSAEAVFNLIDDFAGDVDNIFVISHNQALKDSFPTVLTVIKEGGLARIARSGS